MKPLLSLKSIFAGLAILLTINVSAQLSVKDRADKLYNELAYTKAIELYLQTFKRGDKVQDDVIHNLADSYRHITDYQNAEVWYAQAVQLRSRKPIEIYYYAQALKENRKYPEANNWMRLYNELEPNDTRGVMHLTAGDYVSKNNPVIQNYKISNMSINTPGSDFATAFFTDNSLVFASIKDRLSPVKNQFAWRNEPFLDLYISDRVAGGGLSTPQEFSKALNTKYHEGPLCFTNDGLQVYFTRNNTNKNRKKYKKTQYINLKVYRATLAGGDFVNIEELPFNSDEYSVCSPTLSKDGTKLIFSSDMPGGYGGFDLYSVDIEKGFFTRPVNLGSDINSEGNEDFPFYHQSNTLYYASDGRAGLGGLDIYSSRYYKGNWKDVKNLQAPINSSKDDFCFVIDSAMSLGYFSSNREGGQGQDDIYSFLYEVPSEVYNLQGNVYDVNDFPIQDVTVFVNDDRGNVLTKAVTDRDGFFSFNVSRFNKYKLSTQSTKYLTTEMEIPYVPTGDIKSVKLNLERAEYNVVGVIRDENTNLPLGQSKVTLIKSSSLEEQTVVTQNDGKFSFELESNSFYEIKVDKAGYLGTSRVVSTVNKPAGEPIVIDDLALVQLRVGLVFEVPKVYWDYAKYDLRAESVDALLQVVQFLNNNPGLVVELSSHTDCRGDSNDNFILSNKRAQTAVDFVVGRGVSSTRVIAKGYGESLIRNGCFDGVDCTEEQHQYNRRTEVKILSMTTASN